MMSQVYCDKCGGEGVITYIGSGRFSMAQEQWYPDEIEDACDLCDGRGVVFMDTEYDYDDTEFLANL
jgi:DnaJ-class molecular chaperone